MPAAVVNEDVAALELAWSIDTQHGLNQPSAVALAPDLSHEIFYVADTANNRVLKTEVPRLTPDGVWADFKQKLINGDIDGALDHILIELIPQFRQEFMELGNAEINEMMISAGPITSIFLEEESAKYRFFRAYQGSPIAFLVGFVRRMEHGK